MLHEPSVRGWQANLTSMPWRASRAAGQSRVLFAALGLALLLTALSVVASPVLPRAQAQVRGDVRLVNGSEVYEGRVEIYLDGQWGTVCDKEFDLNDALVVCRQLGYPRALEVKGSAHFGEGIDPIGMDHVECQGAEDRLTECVFVDGRFTDCDHSQDVGVVCSETGVVVTPTVLTVVEGGSETYTTVLSVAPTENVTITPMPETAEVTVDKGAGNGIFTTSNWSEAQTFTVTATDDTHSGGGRTILITHTVSGDGDYDGGVVSPVEVTIPDNDPPGKVSGVEIAPFNKELLVTWTPVTHAIGYKVQWKSGGQAYSSTREHVVTADITDTTITLADRRITFSLIAGLTAGTPYTVRVIATKTNSVDGTPSDEVPGTPLASGPAEGGIRLVDETGGAFKGRVEILHVGQWGTICGDGGWSLTDDNATVVCRELGYGGEPKTLLASSVADGSDPVWLDEVVCQGTEDRLVDCNHLEWGDENCTHDEDVGVICNFPPEFEGPSAHRTTIENSGSGVAIGAPVSATDANRDTLTYRLSGQDAGSFTVDSNGQLWTSQALGNRGYSVTLEAEDPHGGSDTIQVTIEVRPPPPPPPPGGGSGSGSSDGDQTGSAAVGYLENPGADSFQSGIGVLSGWVCAADLVEIELNGAVQTAAYGTERGDTEDTCGDTDNGFGLLFNWNLLRDGEHEVVAFVDGVELGRATVTVTTLGSEFLRDVAGTCTVPDFPLPGETVTLAWQENQQNFVLVDGPAPTGATRTGTAGVGYLENPGPYSFQSGIGVLSGWVCDAETVEIEITPESGEVSRHMAGYGTERLDTQDVCGDTDNGFGLLFNWNLLGAGEHAVVAYVDDEELGRATVRVTTLGEEFLQGAAGACVVEDFPTVGEAVTLEWQQNQQNFVVTDIE